MQEEQVPHKFVTLGDVSTCQHTLQLTCNLLVFLASNLGISVGDVNVELHNTTFPSAKAHAVKAWG